MIKSFKIYKISLITFVMLLLNSCISSKIATIECDSGYAISSYYLKDSGSRNDFLISILSENNDSKIIGEKPLVVIDAIPYKYCDNALVDTIPISVNEIATISLLGANKAFKLYGKQASNGVVLITSRAYQERYPNE